MTINDNSYKMSLNNNIPIVPGYLQTVLPMPAGGSTAVPSTEDLLRAEIVGLKARIENLEEHLRRAERELVAKRAGELRDIEASLR